MILKQLSIFVENKQGRLAAVTAALADRGVNIRALALADTERFGILRIIADNTDVALAVLHDIGVTAKVSDVIGVAVKDRPGGLAEILKAFDSVDVNVEYIYAEVQGLGDEALLIMKADPTDRALRALSNTGIR